MFLFILFCILAIIAVIVFGVSFFISRDDDRAFTRLAGGVVTLIALVLLFFASTTSVGTKNVGVETTFGKPTGYVDNGFHLKLPWQKVTELNDAVQTDTYASDNGGTAKQGGATDTCIHVRIERQATACVNVSIKWQIRPDGVDYLFRNYKDNAAITDNLVLRNLQQSLNANFGNYDPLGVNATGLNTNKSLTSYASFVKTELAGKDGKSGVMGKYIDVQSVIIPIINYDTTTQAKVNLLLQQIANTRVAQQQIQTNTAQAQANRALAASVNDDPNVLVSKCLDIVQKELDEGHSLPAGFNCFSANGSTAIAVPSK